MAVVLLDIEMPEMDGYETLAAIKADEGLRHLPVIMISSVDELDSVVRCIELGAMDYLPKPFDPVILALASEPRSPTSACTTSRSNRRAPGGAARHDRAPEGRAQPLLLAPGRGARVSSPEGAQLLAGHRRVATALFCDLRGFTAFSESADPEEVLGVLREYHADDGRADRRARRHARALRRRRDAGVLQRPGAPGGSRRARRAHGGRHARPVQRPRSGWAKRGYELGFGVGIATGYATLGRIGFEGRYDYGMVGFAVITAARLSAAALANQVLLSPRSYADVEDLVEVEQVGELSLKGFSRPIAPYNVLRMRAGVGTAASA